MHRDCFAKARLGSRNHHCFAARYQQTFKTFRLRFADYREIRCEEPAASHSLPYTVALLACEMRRCATAFSSHSIASYIHIHHAKPGHEKGKLASR